MKLKVRYLDSSRKRPCIKVRVGEEVYRHPKGRFVVLEFQGKMGKFRESFWPEEIVSITGR